MARAGRERPPRPPVLYAIAGVEAPGGERGLAAVVAGMAGCPGRRSCRRLLGAVGAAA